MPEKRIGQEDKIFFIESAQLSLIPKYIGVWVYVEFAAAIVIFLVAAIILLKY